MSTLAECSWSFKKGVNNMAIQIVRSFSLTQKGGAGSGNFGHSGVPGQLGGSAAGSGGISAAAGRAMKEKDNSDKGNAAIKRAVQRNIRAKVQAVAKRPKQMADHSEEEDAKASVAAMDAQKAADKKQSASIRGKIEGAKDKAKESGRSAQASYDKVKADKAAGKKPSDFMPGKGGDKTQEARIKLNKEAAVKRLDKASSFGKVGGSKVLQGKAAYTQATKANAELKSMPKDSLINAAMHASKLGDTKTKDRLDKLIFKKK
jgi:hypothetical protein